MDISKELFFRIAKEQELSSLKSENFWNALQTAETTQSSTFSKWLFYFGALIVISAMTWFMGTNWKQFGGGGIFLIAIVYALAFTLMGAKLWKKDSMRTVGGLFITMAVCMTPLAIYGLETYLGVFPEEMKDPNYQDFFSLIRSSWIFMELGTILAGCLALRFFSFPFITAPIFFAAWFLMMDSLPLLLGNEATFKEKQWITLVFGLVMMTVAYFIDRSRREDFAFWGYLFGTLIFWMALNSVAWSEGEGSLFIFFIINLLMMMLSIGLKRNILMILGGFGVFIYLGHLAYEIFQDSMIFPFVLSFIGLSIIYLGAIYQKKQTKNKTTKLL